MPRLSIVIATHKRAGLLKTCLERLAAQTIADQLEVIVVSDGHDPETATIMEAHVKTSRGTSPQVEQVTFVEIEKSQQGVARNEGVKRATAPYVLFINDDIFLAPDACEVHLHAHERIQREHGTNRSAVLGFITWDPAVGITSVMKWLEESGWQFGYPMIAKHAHDFIPADHQHRFTYASHISLPTSIALRHPFCEDVTLYGWEDILWGMQLAHDGVKLWYEPDAKALHHHYISLQDSLKRMRTLGESAVRISRLDPSLDRLPHGWKLLVYRVIGLLPTMRGYHSKAFVEGIDGVKQAV